MNSQSDAMPESHAQSQAIAAAAFPMTRPLYWSVRREFWENRSIYIAPLAVAAVALFGFVISSILGRWQRELQLPIQQPEKLIEPYEFVALLIMGTAFVVSVFYALDALHGERRDRSILFWKSLPLSDRTVVLSKAAVALIVLPMLAWAITVVTHLVMLLMSTLIALVSGLSVGVLWAHVPLFSMSWELLYHIVTVHMLWYAPIYAWLLLVSAWARRLTFLWAVLPLAAIGVLERVAFHTTRFVGLMGYRMSGPQPNGAGPSMHGMDSIPHVGIGQFLSTPGLWIGLILAAIFLATAIRLRRDRGPM
jgi:ABC-2 type transport system permease protein